MNLVRNPLGIMTPWWYYIETALVSNMLVLLFLGVALVGKHMDTWPAWIYGADYSQIWWSFFWIHVSMASLISILSVCHDRISHPEFLIVIS